MLNRTWGFYSGRPSLMGSMKHTVPCRSPASKYQWKPHVDRNHDTCLSPETDTSVLGMVPPFLTQLAMKMSRIAAILCVHLPAFHFLHTNNFRYTGIPDTVPSTTSFVQSMAQELQQWSRMLPPVLQIDTSQPRSGDQEKEHFPMVIQLHMQYHAAVVLLHRPFVGGVNSPNTQNYLPLSASQMCSQSATEISRLLIMFRRRYSWRYVHLQAVHNATIAGVVHAYDACVFPGERGKLAQENLNVCVQALGEMAQSFKSSTRGYEVIAAVRREWHDQKFAHAGNKRSRGSASQNQNVRPSVKQR
jgi:hypothetical protein